MLQAMNTGHEGSMTTVHANNARDAIGRLEVMIAMAGYDIPPKALRTQIASAINIVVQARRLTGGKRKVVSVSEITGMEGELLQMHDLFTFEQRGVDENGAAFGFFRSCRRWRIFSVPIPASARLPPNCGWMRIWRRTRRPTRPSWSRSIKHSRAMVSNAGS